jgi:MFS superfamily sulfate permease-like transporter
MLLLAHSSLLSVSFGSRLAVGVLLLLASVSKLLIFPEFVKTIGEFEIVPRRFATAGAWLIVFLELLTAIFFLGRIQLRFATYSAIALVSGFTAAIIINLVRGRFNLQCGCFTFWKKSKIGWHLLFRNLGLAGLAVLCNLPDHPVRGLLPAILFVLFLAFTTVPLISSASEPVHQH